MLPLPPAVILHELRSGAFTRGVSGRVVGLRPEREKLLASFPSDETLRRMEAGPAPVGVPDGLDPVSWTPSERRIRCPTWGQASRGGSGVASTGTGGCTGAVCRPARA